MACVCSSSRLLAPALLLLMSAVPSAAVNAAAIPPINDALHVMPPVGRSLRTFSPLDTTLTAYLSVAVYEVTGDGSPVLVRTFTSAENHSGPGLITLQRWRPQEKYFVYRAFDWQDQGKTFDIRFEVGGLLLDTIRYVRRSGGEADLDFLIDDHPAIRARVLHLQGRSATQVAQALVDQFHLTSQQVVGVLNDEGFPPAELSTSLRDVFALAPTEIASALKAEGFTNCEIARAMREGLAQTPVEVGAILRALSPGDSPVVFAQDLGCAEFSVAEVYEAMKGNLDVTPDESAAILEEAGFDGQAIFAAILPDLRAIYEGLISDYAPIVYLHPSEQHLPSSVEWYLDRATLIATAGDNFQTALATSSATFEADLAALSASVPDARAFELSIAEADRGGDIASSRCYVHAVRPADQPDTLDLQFWLFYPYNGPRTLNSRIGTVWSSGDMPNRYGNLAPYGAYSGDWEAIYLRFRLIDRQYQLYSVFASCAGGYPEIRLTDAYGDGVPVLQMEQGDHPVMFASLNGHDHYPWEDDNAYLKKQRDFPLGQLNAAFLNWTARGVELDTWNACDIVGIDYGTLDASWTNDACWMRFGGASTPECFWGPWSTERGYSISEAQPATTRAFASTIGVLDRLICDACSVACPLCLVATYAPLREKLIYFRNDLADQLAAEASLGSGPTTPTRRPEWGYRSYPGEPRQ